MSGLASYSGAVSNFGSNQESVKNFLDNYDSGYYTDYNSRLSDFKKAVAEQSETGAKLVEAGETTESLAAGSVGTYHAYRRFKGLRAQKNDGDEEGNDLGEEDPPSFEDPDYDVVAPETTDPNPPPPFEDPDYDVVATSGDAGAAEGAGVAAAEGAGAGAATAEGAGGAVAEGAGAAVAEGAGAAVAESALAAGAVVAAEAIPVLGAAALLGYGLWREFGHHHGNSPTKPPPPSAPTSQNQKSEMVVPTFDSVTDIAASVSAF